MDEETLKNAQILIVDTRTSIFSSSREILSEAGYTRLRSATDLPKILPSFVDCKPDLILLDLHVPSLDGFAIMERLSPLVEGQAYLPILVLTADKHTYRVGELAAKLATRLGLPPSDVELIRLAAPLHDVGKIGIPDHILLKPAALTSDEFEVVSTVSSNRLRLSQDIA